MYVSCTLHIAAMSLFARPRFVSTVSVWRFETSGLVDIYDVYY